MFPADGLNREGDMSYCTECESLNMHTSTCSKFKKMRQEAVEAQRNAMPFCPGCRKYHREGHQFCENYAKDTLQQQSFKAVPRTPILDEREKEYGSFTKIADNSCMIRDYLLRGQNSQSGYTLVEREALTMIATKLARIINNPHHADSWRDIAGYCNLVLESY